MLVDKPADAIKRAMIERMQHLLPPVEGPIRDRRSDFTIARDSLRDIAANGKSESDQINASKALISISTTTAEGLVDLAIQSGISPTEFIAALNARWGSVTVEG